MGEQRELYSRRTLPGPWLDAVDEARAPIHSRRRRRSPGAATPHRQSSSPLWSCSAIPLALPPPTTGCRLSGPSAFHLQTNHSSGPPGRQAGASRASKSGIGHGATISCCSALALAPAALELHSCNEVLAASGETPASPSFFLTGSSPHPPPPFSSRSGRFRNQSRNPNRAWARLPVSSPPKLPGRSRASQVGRVTGSSSQARRQATTSHQPVAGSCPPPLTEPGEAGARSAPRPSVATATTGLAGRAAR